MQLLGRRARWGGAWLVTIVSLTCCGCSDRQSVYRVQGRILFEGKPLVGGGAIAFVPLGKQAGKTAGGEIASDGTYRLTTYSSGDGSMPGEFRVVITQTVDKEPEAVPDGQTRATGSTQVVAPEDRIPPIYADHQNSPLTTKVEAKSSNELNFDLKRSAQPPPKVREGAMLDSPFGPQFASLKP